jgi:hypothetical protein
MGILPDLKDYKQTPIPEKKPELENRFDEIFTTRTSYETLNKAGKRFVATTNLTSPLIFRSVSS